jgi:antitoxin component YwqK of YwqJK toxin-antitoxin module
MKFKNTLPVMIAIFFFGVLLASLGFAEEQPKANSPVPKVAASDTNKDGKPDQWQYYENGQIVRTEADTNYDGKVDHWQTYENGKIVRTEADTNNDGKVDEIGHFTDGKLTKVEKDSDYDGKMDTWVDY